MEDDAGGLDYDTQIEVLRSPHVMNPIVKDLAAKYPEISYEELIKPKRSPSEDRAVGQNQNFRSLFY